MNPSCVSCVTAEAMAYMTFSVTEPVTAKSLEQSGQVSCLSLMGTAVTTKRRFARLRVVPAALLWLALASSAQ